MDVSPGRPGSAELREAPGAVTHASVALLVVSALLVLAALVLLLLDRASYMIFESQAGGLLSAAGLMFSAVAVLVSGVDRARREPGQSVVWLRILVVTMTLLLGAQAVAAVLDDVDARLFPVPADAIPFLLAAPVLVVCLFGLAWPSGLESRQWQGIVADAAVGALGAAIIWTILVFPGLDFDTVESRSVPSGSIGVQFATVIAVLVLAAASRRRSRLPIVQVVPLQLSVLVYVCANALSDVVLGFDREAVVAFTSPAYVASAMLMVTFTDRPANEHERPRDLWLRDTWSSIVPLSPVALAAGGLLLLLVQGFPASGVAAGAVAGILLALMLTVIWLRHIAAEDVRRASVAVASSTLHQATGQAWFQTLIRDSKELVLVTDRGAKIVYVSPSVSRLVGVKPEDLLGRSVDCISSGLTREAVVDAGGPSEAKAYAHLEVTVVDAAGGEHGVRFAVSALTGLGSEGYVLTGHDVTDTRRMRALLGESRKRDALTGLLSREAFLATVEDALEVASSSGLAVVEIDLVGFRALNDTRGHATGDEVLRGVADVLERSGGPILAVTRISGDDFALLLRDREIDVAVEVTVSEIRAGLRSIPLSGGDSVSFRVAAGYATTTTERVGSAGLLERADLAVARSAADPEVTLVRYEPAMRNALVEQMRSTEEIERSLSREDFVPHYMPVVRLRDGKTVSVEALARRRLPGGRWERSEAFISLAERAGLVAWLDHDVRKRAFADIAALQDICPGLTVSVNVSPMEFSDDLPNDIAQQIDQARIDPELIIVEMTESTVAKSSELSQAIISRLRGMGCRVALDDFGTGYSSLSGLGTMELDILKIDRSFASDLGTSFRAQSVMRSITKLGHSLGLVTVAEGVLTTEQADLLKGMGCEWAQGHLYAEALPFSDLVDWLAVEGNAGAADRQHADDPQI